MNDPMAAFPNERTLKTVATMDRQSLVHVIRHLNCTFTLDFSDEFLKGLSLERLRHIALAAMVHSNGGSSQAPS